MMNRNYLDFNLLSQFRKERACFLTLETNFNGEDLQGVSSTLIDFFAEIFPYLHALVLIVINFSLITGGIIYLINERGENGKNMTMRAVAMFLLYYFIFNDSLIQHRSILSEYAQIEHLTTFISLYLLFILAALSLIILIGTCGLYIISPDPSLLRQIRKSLLCFLAVIVPLGINFPQIPKW
jgi:hypothetical protein